MNQPEALHRQLSRFQRIALIIGAVGLIALIAGAFINREIFFQSYLLAFVFWVHVALGSMAALMLHHIVGGTWGFVIRRFTEAASLVTILMAVFFIPIIFGMQDLYIWTNPDVVAHSPLLQHKEGYLNVPFFIARTAVYFIVWITVALILNRLSRKQDETGDPKIQQRLKAVSAPGLILWVLTGTFAAFDWMMSLEPEWFSSIYGVLYLSGQALVTVAFVIIMLRFTSKNEPFATRGNTKIFNDLGNFLLAFVSFWAYIAFSQYLIIWSGNLPEEVPWYITRSEGGWQYVGMALIAFHFILPFVVLLSRANKRRAGLLAGVSMVIVVMRLVDLFWMIMPALRPNGFSIHWLDIVAPVAMGGFWLAFFAWQFKRKAPLPMNDPRFEEVSAHD